MPNFFDKLKTLVSGSKGKDGNADQAEDVMGDFLGAVGSDAPGYAGSSRRTIEAPIAPRRGIDLGRIEEEPSEPMEDADTSHEYQPESVAHAATPPPRQEKPGEEDGWGALDFGEGGQ